MNITKIFGFILALHLGVITVLFIQPGCRSTSVLPPTPSEYQTNALNTEDLSTISSELESVYTESAEDASRLSDDDLSAFNEIDGFETVLAEEETLTVSVQEDSVDVHIIVAGDTLWDLAQRYDTSVNELCEMNGISKNSTLRIGDALEVPRVGDSVRSVSKENAAIYQPSNYEGTGQVYRVVSGDTLSKIAIRFGVSVAAIKATNNLTSDRILIDQELLIPVDAVVKVQAKSTVLSNEETIINKEPVTISPDTVAVSVAVEEAKSSSTLSDTGVGLEQPQSELDETVPSVLEASEDSASDTIIDIDAMPQVEYRRVDSTTE